jgi:hypothetical protein
MDFSPEIVFSVGSDCEKAPNPMPSTRNLKNEKPLTESLKD